jgi:hypothetical protein
LLDALAKNKTLKDVQLSNILLGRYGSLAIARWIAENEKIEKIFLSGSLDGEINDEVDPHQLADVDVASIAQALSTNRTLKTLSLSRCITSLGDSRIMSNIGQRNHALEALHLCCLIDANGISQLCRLIENCSGLKFCALSGLVAMDCTMVDSFCRALRRNESLSQLMLYNTKIGDSGVAVLTKFIAGHAMLKRLSLHANNITDDGFVLFANALKQNTMLEALSLEGSDNVGDRGIRAMLGAIKENSSLTNVTLQEGKLSRAQSEELAFYMERNKGARPLLSQSPPLGLWSHALERATNHTYEHGFDMFDAPVDLVYYLVREKHVELLSNVPRNRKRKRGRK